MTKGIYCIKNTVNGKIYIGQSFDIEKRVKSHLNSGHLTHNSRLNNDIIAYGKEVFTVEILASGDCLSPLELSHLETKYIKKYKAWDPLRGYNYVIENNQSIKRGKDHPLTRPVLETSSGTIFEDRKSTRLNS